MRSAGRVLAAAALVVCTWLPARRAAAASPVDSLLWAASSSSKLRAALIAFATTARETSTVNRGAAWYYAGMSYEQSGSPDSALLCYEKAVSIRGASPERDAFVDALLSRGNAEDGGRALEILGPRLKVALFNAETDIAVTRGRWAWARYIQGHGDSALAGLRLQQRWLLDPMTPRRRDWQYRLGLVELENGDPSKCVEFMVPLAVASRFQDRDVMGILRDAGAKLPQGPGLPDYMRKELSRIDNEDQEILTALRAKRVAFTGTDGYKLAGVVYGGVSGRPARAAIAVLNPSETFDTYDSLAAGLVRSGYAVFVLDPRGCGWSVSAAVPMPETWRGREDEIRHQVAQDAVHALSVLARNARVDTTRYLLIGAGATVSTLAEVTSRDRRVAALVFLGPDPSPVDRGIVRARLRASRDPVYFVVPALESKTLPVAEGLYESLDPRACRISESDLPGMSAYIFRHDRSALPRLLKWLDETWSASKPAPSKKGR
jgi:pimeloyl-ACP methyl ester carboxylesterase